MDMLVAVKDMKVITGIENVSKTKVRGIFALLKNAQCLSTINTEGESVQLVLSEGVNSFKDFKEKHDNFFLQVLNQLRIHLPLEVKCYLVWQWENYELIAKKVSEMLQFEEVIEDFFLNGKPAIGSTSESNFPASAYGAVDDEEQFYNDGENLNYSFVFLLL
jgi:hypothetical protein